MSYSITLMIYPLDCCWIFISCYVDLMVTKVVLELARREFRVPRLRAYNLPKYGGPNFDPEARES